MARVRKRLAEDNDDADLDGARPIDLQRRALEAIKLGLSKLGLSELDEEKPAESA